MIINKKYYTCITPHKVKVKNFLVNTWAALQNLCGCSKNACPCVTLLNTTQV